ncbi:hypothetical protein FOA43_002772 [Brettanomyces nanus]|uniref:Uncharacterized protein n=1 Tax=Eeniella nana TaxID=13502 RepID=A0A875S398_EENNA|nr:uncharacterized protein FOA43_002772 [Brettanomyces nanus]QPG75418.1 hypothetical protein FOA43_002772 [Brettanomyces nanus]
MRQDGISTTRVEEYKDTMTLARYLSYTKLLGARETVKNGMFHTFGFVNGKHHLWRVTDLPQLVNGLAIENPKIDYVTGLKLIEQMHGFHIKEYTQRYSPLLHPDVQMKRIYQTILKKNPSDEEVTRKLDQVSQSLRGNSAAKFGKPEKMTSAYRNRGSVTDKAVFQVLPLNIVLKVISLTTNDLAVSLKLVRTMIKRHQCRINNETLLYLTRVFQKNPEAVEQFGEFFEGFRAEIVLNRQMYRAILEVLMRGHNTNLIYQFMRNYVDDGYPISTVMFEKMTLIFGLQNDERYKEFSPCLY